MALKCFESKTTIKDKRDAITAKTWKKKTVSLEKSGSEKKNPTPKKIQALKTKPIAKCQRAKTIGIRC